MKKYITILLMIIALLSLTACGEKDAENSQISANSASQGEGGYSDIQAETRQLWNMEEGLLFRCMGLQFYQGEPVQLWGLSHSAEDAEGTEKAEGIDIYLYRSDGSRELLYQNLPKGESYHLSTGLLDGEGAFYCVRPDTIIKLDGEGKEVYRTSVINATGGTAHDVCSLPDGSLVVMVFENETGNTRLWKMDGETGRFAEKDMGLGIETLSYIAAGETGVYLLDKDGIWAVNETDGSKRAVLPFAGTTYVAGISSAKNSYKTAEDFRVQEDGTVEILWLENAAGILETLKPNRIEERTVLVLRAVELGNNVLKKKIMEFNSISESYYIVVEECGEGTEPNDFIAQTGVRLAAGKGADIFFGNEMRNVLWSLLEKGTFEDLAPYMDTSGIKEEDYFPFVFDAWKRDGGIYGIITNLAVNSYQISTEVLGDFEVPDGVGELADVLLAYEEEAVFINGYDSPRVLRWFLQGSESLWGMLDWETGSCDFGGELFPKLMETAKRYGYDGRNNYQALISTAPASNFYTYITREGMEKEGNVLIGPFFDDGFHPVADDYCMLAVSAASEHKEGAWAFLEFLLSDTVQNDSEYVNIPSQREAFWKRVDTEIAEGAVMKIGSVKIVKGYGEDLTMEKAEELAETIEAARPYPIRTEPILDIVCGEAEEYFNGTKSIEEVAAVIENRVALYMEENK